MDLSRYMNHFELPCAPDKLKRLKRNPTAQETRQHVENLEAWEREQAEYEVEKAAYQAEEKHLHDLFLQDAFDELGIADHPKRHRLYALANVIGCNEGLYRVWDWMQSLSELIL